MDKFANLATDGLLPVGQRSDVGVNARVGRVGHGLPSVVNRRLGRCSVFLTPRSAVTIVDSAAERRERIFEVLR
jgi:hypothetical protein